MMHRDIEIDQATSLPMQSSHYRATLSDYIQHVLKGLRGELDRVRKTLKQQGTPDCQHTD